MADSILMTQFNVGQQPFMGFGKCSKWNCCFRHAANKADAQVETSSNLRNRGQSKEVRRKAFNTP